MPRSNPDHIGEITARRDGADVRDARGVVFVRSGHLAVVVPGEGTQHEVNPP
jgi:hypothetical protein